MLNGRKSCRADQTSRSFDLHGLPQRLTHTFEAGSGSAVDNALAAGLCLTTRHLRDASPAVLKDAFASLAEAIAGIEARLPGDYATNHKPGSCRRPCPRADSSRPVQK
jgi:hypothetical protein